MNAAIERGAEKKAGPAWPSSVCGGGVGVRFLYLPWVFECRARLGLMGVKDQSRGTDVDLRIIHPSCPGD